MCDKAVDNYPNALKFVPDCYMTQKMCYRAVNTYHSTIKLFLISKSQEMCDKVISVDSFAVRYDQYKT